jgi:hypothetical protein
MNKQVEEMDRVVFRVDPKDGEVIAFLPDEPANWSRVVCYTYVGQHGEADWDYYHTTKRATPDQYQELMNELNERGYKVKPYKRMPRRDTLKMYAYNTEKEA